MVLETQLMVTLILIPQENLTKDIPDRMTHKEYMKKKLDDMKVSIHYRQVLLFCIITLSHKGVGNGTPISTQIEVSTANF